VIVDCSIEECCANEFMSYSRGALKDFYGRDGGLLKEFVHYSSHCLRNRSVYRFPPGFSPREFLWTVEWKRINPNTMAMAFVPAIAADVPPKKEYVRAEGWTLVEFTRIANTNAF